MVEDNDNTYTDNTYTGNTYPDKVSEANPTESNSNSYQTLVTARGTGDGLIVRLNTKKGYSALRAALEAFLMSRKSFLAGNQVTLEWIGSSLTEDEAEEINTHFRNYEISVRKPVPNVHNLNSDILALTGGDFAGGDFSGHNNSDENIGGALFGGIAKNNITARDFTDNYSVKTSLRNNLTFNSDGVVAEQEGSSVGYERVSLKNLKTGDLPTGGSKNSGIPDSSFWDESDTRAVFTTLRSGQKIETEHSVLIVGDINSGAEIIAGGDIFVLGALRGVAHAGAFDETGGGRVIMALDLQPTQLRIGTVISRGAGESTTVRSVSSSHNKSTGKMTASSGKSVDYSCTPEVAYVDGTNIVVEPYNSRVASQRGVGLKGATANFR